MDELIQRNYILLKIDLFSFRALLPSLIPYDRDPICFAHSPLQNSIENFPKSFVRKFSVNFVDARKSSSESDKHHQTKCIRAHCTFSAIVLQQYHKCIVYFSVQEIRFVVWI